MTDTKTSAATAVSNAELQRQPSISSSNQDPQAAASDSEQEKEKDKNSDANVSVDGVTPVLARDDGDLEHSGEKGDQVITTGEDVSNILISDRDDGDPSFTFRSITLALLASGFQASMYQIYFFKPTEIGISSTFLALIIFVIGKAWGSFLPTSASLENRLGSRAGWRSSLIAIAGFINPGPFGLKEHAVASITASSASNATHSISVFATQKLFYDIPVTALNAILATLSIGLFGYGLAGLFRPIIVYPAQMVYWGTLPTVDLFQALHWDTGKTSKRVKTFWYSLTGMALYQTIPAYIMPWLNSVSIPCIAAAHAPARIASDLTNFFGGANSNEGLGLFSISLDWQYITSSAVSYPLIQQANSWIGLFICYIIMIAFYYGNVWSAKSFPFMSTSLWASNGTKYPQSKVFVNGVLQHSKLDEFGYPNVAATYAWGMLARNLAIGALITHVILFWGKDVIKSIKHSRNKTQPDRHWIAMQKYSEASWLWYVAILVVSFILGLVVIIRENTTLPVWGYIMSLVVGIVIAPFSGVLYAILGNGISTNQLCKMIAGALHPGRPLANLYFYAWSHSTIAQTINLSNDLKMGQYLKIPPRVMFVSQIAGTIFGAFINYAVMTSIVHNKRELLLTNNGSNVWSGANAQSLNASAVTWSLAKDMYGPNTVYFVIPMAVFIGAAAVVAHWLFARAVPRIGNFSTRDLILPTVFLYSAWMTSGQNCTILSTILIGFISQAWVRRRYPLLFRKYNYILGAGLDGGSLLVLFVLSFAVFGAAGKQHPFPTWWGNADGFPDHCPTPDS